MVQDKLSLGTHKAWQTKWTIGKFLDPDGKIEALSKSGLKASEIAMLMPDRCKDISVVEGNMALNEGIARLLSLLIGTGGTAFSNAAAYIGVGDSSTAEAATQVALQAATNKYWVIMDATFPSIVAQTVTFKATFGTAIANFAWNEFTVVNASTDAGDNLNRKVSAKGTKVVGETWIAQVDITVS